MYNHAPKDYVCPFCSLLLGVKNENVVSVPDDIFYQDEYISAIISSRQWVHNQGHALVIPNEHCENIYELPVELGAKIHILAQKIALAMKILYECDGVSTRQQNEPAGNQDVRHYHLHVLPRYVNDQLYTSHYAEMPAKQRADYAKLLRKYFEDTVYGS